MKGIQTLSESALIDQLRNPRQRERAFAVVMQRYQEPLYWHARRMVKTHDDADDMLQNTFIKAWKNLDKFRGDAKLKTWLYRIVTNECLTFISRQKKQNFGELADIENDMQHSHSGSGAMTGEEIQAKLTAAVATLPDKQKLVFTMKYYDEMKYKEMAEVLGGSIGSLKASFHHAVKKIENFLRTA